MHVAELTLNEAVPFASFTTSSAEAAALQVFHVLKNNWTGLLDDVNVQSDDAGTTEFPDPPDSTPGWGNVPVLWIAAFFGSSVASVDDYPDGFDNGQNSLGGTGTTGASVSSAYLNAKAEEIDPAPFDLAASTVGVAFTIAVKPFASTTLRFAVGASFLPKTIDAYPNIADISHTPAVIGLGDNLGQRATLKVTFKDSPHSDSGPGYDEYLSDRSYDPFELGTHWGKFRARQPFLAGSACRLIRGLEGQDIDAMNVYNFIVEGTDGPGMDGMFSITAKDVLKLLDGDKSQAPTPNTASLQNAEVAANVTLELTPTGIGDDEFPTSGYVCIGGNEICSFTRTAGSDSPTAARGQLEHDGKDHDAGERVQLVLRYSGEDVADIIADLLINYAGIQPNYVPLTSWRTKNGTYLNQVYTAAICEPTSVNKLVSELIEQAGLSLWWSDLPALINLQVLRTIASSASVIDETVIVQDTLSIADQPDKRASQIWTYFGQRDPTRPVDEESNFTNIEVTIDAEAEEDYATSAIRKIYSRWIAAGGSTTADRLGQILLSRYNPAPRKFAFKLFESGSLAVVPGTGYRISALPLQDFNGNADEIPIQVTGVKSEDDGITVTAEELTISPPIGLVDDVITITGSENNVDSQPCTSALSGRGERRQRRLLYQLERGDRLG